MFEGEKSNLFWVGLLVLGFASLVLFTAIWQIIVSYLNYCLDLLPYFTLTPTPLSGHMFP